MNSTFDNNSTFAEEIEHNSGICENCYRRVKDTIELPDRVPDCATDMLEYSTSVYFDYFDDEGSTERPSRKKSYCVCGNVDGAKIRPLGKREMMDAAVRISERLEEEGIEFDEDVFFDEVKTEIPEQRFREEEVFQDAVEAAIAADDSTEQQETVVV